MWQLPGPKRRKRNLTVMSGPVPVTEGLVNVAAAQDAPSTLSLEKLHEAIQK